MQLKYDLVIVTGPTATGKTSFAANLAAEINAEIISADSRQVYKQMDIGTGKDLEDYIVNDNLIPYHLINLVEPGSKYNVYEYQKDFYKAYELIKSYGKNAILCGGTGMYIDSIINAYKLINVPVNEEFRKIWEKQNDQELINELKKLKSLHNVSDTSNRKRLIRALEISTYYNENNVKEADFPDLNYFILGINFDRPQIRKRISKRLEYRLQNGMIEEVQTLLDSGITTENLIYYGLEYKFITLYLINELNYNEMYSKLNTAIHQFAKRQMTWFRRMERKGIKIHWLDGYANMDKKIESALFLME